MTETWTTETWVYLGRRESKGKLQQRLRTPSGDEVIYSGLKGLHVIGGEYEFQVRRDGDQTFVRTTASWTGAQVDNQADRIDWERLDRHAQRRVEDLRREKNLGRQSELDEALAPLLAIAERCRTRAERESLTAAVLTKMAVIW